ncbi:hypothetical protein AB0H12_01390 [Actinosynnema sp. NPDC023794]
MAGPPPRAGPAWAIGVPMDPATARCSRGGCSAVVPEWGLPSHDADLVEASFTRSRCSWRRRPPGR